MKILKKLKRALLFPLVGLIFATSALNSSTPVYADPTANTTPVTSETTPVETETTPVNTETVPEIPNTPEEGTTEESTDDPEKTEETDEKEGEATENATCYSQVGGLGYILCPAMAFLSKAIDTIYGVIEDFLIIEPISMEENSPVFTIWVYIRNITNIVFIIFFLFIIYSQITGFGISNYGIKKALPRLIVAAILVNLSFIICAIAVDLSNIIGKSLHDFLGNIANDALANGVLSGATGEDGNVGVSFYSIFTTIAAGGVIGSLAIGLSGGPLGLLLSLIPVILSGVIAVVIGLATIALRHAVIILLVSIAPLAFVAYLLPNTEKYFKKWTDIFSQMLFFYPMFALLFGASKLASWIFISSANSMLGIILGLGVQVIPLFLAVSMMKMSGSVLGKVSSGLDKLGQKANAGIRTATDPYKNLAKQRSLNRAMQRPFNPLSGSSWRALSAKQQTNLKFQQEQADKVQTGLQREQLNALRRNQRIIGYDKNNQPIYTQLPVRVKANKYMDAEAEAREVDLRMQADDLKVENIYSSLGDYTKEHKIRGRAAERGDRMGNHYLDLRTQQEAKKQNDEYDERFYNEQVIQAADRYVTSDPNGKYKAGDLKDAAAYDRLVNGALGAQGYKVNRSDDKGQRNYEQARVNVIGDAYSQNEAQRNQNIKRFETYMDKQVTAEVLRQYEDFIANDNIDGIIASHNVLARRGDYDKIAGHMTDYLNSNKVKLTEDSANALAMNFLSMKDAAPVLARLGKFINMETWAYTDGKRKTQEVTMEQYLNGKIENDSVDENGNPKTYTTKIKVATGMEGTRLNGIDRTAYEALDAITKQFATSGNYDVGSAVDARWEIEETMLPQELSALPTFASGSEQIRSMVAHMTGMKYSSKTGKWEDNIHIEERNSFEQEVETQVTARVMEKYLKSLTARDLISMKSDTWGGIVARISMDKAKENHIDTSTKTGREQAEELAHAELRKLLETRITKIASGNMNADMMKEPIYNALQIGERRQEIFEQRREENEKWRQGQRNKKGTGPIPSADDGDGTDDSAEN